MELIFEKDYTRPDDDENVAMYMDVEVWRKNGKIIEDTHLDTLVVEVHKDGGPSGYVVTGDVTDVDIEDVKKACDALWELVINDEDSFLHDNWLDPIATAVAGPGMYQLNSLGWRVLYD